MSEFVKRDGQILHSIDDGLIVLRDYAGQLMCLLCGHLWELTTIRQGMTKEERDSADRS